MAPILSRPAVALLLIALYLLMCAAVWWRHRRRLRQAADAAAALLPAADAGPPVLVLHASQTGQAEEIAWQTAKALHLAGMPVRVAALGEIDQEALRGARHALFIASTYGEGDAPDSAAPFARDLMAAEGAAWICPRWKSACWRWATRPTRISAASAARSMPGCTSAARVRCSIASRPIAPTSMRSPHGANGSVTSPAPPISPNGRCRSSRRGVCARGDI